jgi:hypothetical protein
MARDNSQCFRCGTVLTERWPGYSCHHRRLRSGGGPDTLDNRIMLCGSGTTGCHGYVHSNRLEAGIGGWIVSRYGPGPGDVAVCHHQLGPVYLTEDGQLITSELYQLAREENTDAREGNADG